MTPTLASEEVDFDPARCRYARAMVRCCVTIASLLTAGQAAAFQATQPVEGRPAVARIEPKLPGAVELLPDGLGASAPFDVAAFFTSLPAELNAAPLYLDALFEFDAGMFVCFPPGSETSRRKQLAERRGRTLDELHSAFTKDPASVSGEAIDRLVAELEAGMLKLEEAQHRPRCMFQTGLHSMSPLPHAQAARRVARLVTLRTRRSLDRGDLDQPLHDLAIVLRLIRDLRPRGPMICQLVATAMTGACTVQITPLLLASPALRDPHARRLLELFVDHEAASIDGFQEGLKFEYLALRKLLADVVKDPHGSIPELLDQILTDGKNGPRQKPRAYTQIVRHQIENMSVEQIKQVNAKVDQVFRDLLALQDRPFSHWPQEPFDVKRFLDGSFYSKLPAMFLPAARSFGEAEARAKVYVRGTTCLIALRMWMDRTHQVPSDLDTVVKAAGLPKVPIDPYSGEPLRLVLLDGKPVVYSIGKDGRDDGGRIDSDHGRKPGDQTYRLPAIEKPKS